MAPPNGVSDHADPSTDEQPVVVVEADEPYVDESDEVAEARLSRRSVILVVVLLLVISGAIGVLIGLSSGSGGTGQRPVTTLAPKPPTTAATSTPTVPASTTVP